MNAEHEDGYVLVWEHGGQTAQLPAPPPPKKKSGWQKIWFRSVVLYLLEKTFHRLS